MPMSADSSTVIVRPAIDECSLKWTDTGVGAYAIRAPVARMRRQRFQSPGSSQIHASGS